MLSLVVLFYLADICDGLHIACTAVFFLIGIALVVSMFTMAVMADGCYDNDEFKQKLLRFKWLAKTIVIVGVIASIINILIPTQKTVYMIAGTIIVNQTANEVINSDMYKKLYNVINEKLDYIVKADKNK